MHIDTGVLRAELTDCCAKDSWTTKRKLIMEFAVKGRCSGSTYAAGAFAPVDFQ